MTRAEVLDLVERARLPHYAHGDCEAIIGLDPCGGPALLRPDATFAECPECKRTGESLARLLAELDAETFDPAAPDAAQVERLASGPAVAGVSAVVEATLGGLVMNPAREAVCAALRKLADEVRPLDLLGREHARFEATERVKALGFAPEEAKALVRAALKDPNGSAHEKKQGAAVAPADPEWWPDAVEGAELADELAATFTRHVVLPPGAADALALWTLHAHAHDAAHVSPLIVLMSAEKRSGKTTTLLVMNALVPRPIVAANMTSAVLFRTVDRYKPTLLLDEAETFTQENEELRGIINAGHVRAAASVYRCEGDANEPRGYSAWCPKAIALIGRLPGTLEDRALIIGLRRKAPGESTVPFRLDRLGDLEPLRRRAWRWAQDHLDGLRSADPAVPRELHDRAQDNWRPLLAIADALGAEWPARAQRAALTLTAMGPESDSAGEMILADLRDLYGEMGADRLSSEAIVTALAKLEHRPWAEWRKGNPLTKNQLARLLKRFEIAPRTIKLSEGTTAKGYHAEQFEDDWARHLPAAPISEPSPRNHEPFMRPRRVFEPSPDGDEVTLRNLTIPAPIADGYGVTVEAEAARVAPSDLRDFMNRVLRAEP